MSVWEGVSPAHVNFKALQAPLSSRTAPFAKLCLKQEQHRRGWPCLPPAGAQQGPFISDGTGSGGREKDSAMGPSKY